MNDNDHGASRAQSYYELDDAWKFYVKLWGGTDIHMSLLDENEDGADGNRMTVEDVKEGSYKTTEWLMNHIPDELMNRAQVRIADLGAGLGNTTRRLAYKLENSVADCYDISTQYCNWNEDKNMSAGLADRIKVHQLSICDTKAPDNYYDVIVSQDAMVHIDNKDALISEISRILAPGGYLIFTDSMKVDTTKCSEIQPILERLRLADMASPSLYESLFREVGIEMISFEERQEAMARHYNATGTLLQKYGKDHQISQDYIDSACRGLKHWVAGARGNKITWGLFVFHKKE